MNMIFKRALCVLGLLASSTAAMAADAIDVTIYIDQSFRTQWGSATAGGRTKATAIFNDVAAYYKTNFNLDLRLARVEVPFFNVDTAQDGAETTRGTILNIMRTNISVPNGQTASAHPTHWLLVHRDTGTRLQGRADNIGGLSKTRFPNLWISTLELRASASNPFFGTCPAISRPRTAAQIRHTAVHEFGHLMAARHPGGTCSNSVMCLPGPAECIGGLQDPTWQEPATTEVMDATNSTAIKTHRNCYLGTVFQWTPCFNQGTP
jgi:Metallo-peptidase family M12